MYIVNGTQRTPLDRHLIVLLKQHREHILLLKNQWTNPFVSTARLDWHIRHATLRAEEIGGAPIDGQNLTWLTMMTVDNATPENDLFVNEVPEEELEVLDLSEVLVEEMVLLTADDEDQPDDDNGAERDAEDLRMLQSSGDNERRSFEPHYEGDLHALQPSSSNENRSLKPRHADDWRALQSSGGDGNRSLGPRFDDDVSSFLELAYSSSDVQALQSSAKHFLQLGERGTFLFELADILCVAKRRTISVSMEVHYCYKT